MNIEKYPKELCELLDNMVCEANDIGCSSAGVYRYYNSTDSYYLKVQLESVQHGLKKEFEIMEWLHNKLPVPRVIYFNSIDGYEYLLMTQIEGYMSCSNYYLSRTVETVKLLAEGIKMLQCVPIDNCPFNNSLEIKLNDARENIENNLVDMSDWETNNRFNSPHELLEYLQNNKPAVSTNIFTHGDYCLPNILCKDNKISGFIDLGRSGMADIYQDIALCVRSLDHNLGTTEFNDMFFKCLELEPNWEKIDYYILLDELF